MRTGCGKYKHIMLLVWKKVVFLFAFVANANPNRNWVGMLRRVPLRERVSFHFTSGLLRFLFTNLNLRVNRFSGELMTAAVFTRVD